MSTHTKQMERNFAKRCLSNGGQIMPMLVDSSKTNGTGLCNPSIIIYPLSDTIVANIRHVGYDLHHSEEKIFQSWHGPLIYLHPENDVKLRTENYITYYDINTLEEKSKPVKIKMLDLHKPIWTFIGLEDARLTFWNNQLNFIGVRRDTTDNGVGRMEISVVKNNKEISRKRIEPPKEAYCEKNWMPIIDQPNRFLKWTIPTEIVEVHGEKAETVILNETKIEHSEITRDIRGGSQVVPFGDGYLCITHEVDLWREENGHKDAQYYHRFFFFNKHFEIVDFTPEFKFMDFKIEFCCGLAIKDDQAYISFGAQDNAAYLLKVHTDVIKKFFRYA